LIGKIYTDYAVVIIGAIFVFAGGWWIVGAHKWFKGPINTVEGLLSTSGSLNSQEKVDEKRL
jgi:hypothetical protein